MSDWVDRIKRDSVDTIKFRVNKLLEEVKHLNSGLTALKGKEHKEAQKILREKKANYMYEIECLKRFQDRLNSEDI